LASNIWIATAAVNPILGFEPSWFIDYTNPPETDSFAPQSKLYGQILQFRQQIARNQKPCYNIENGPKNLWRIGTRSEIHLTPLWPVQEPQIVGWKFYNVNNCQEAGLVGKRDPKDAQYTASTVQFAWPLAEQGPNLEMSLSDVLGYPAPEKEKTQGIVSDMKDENEDDNVFMSMPTYTPLQNIASIEPIFANGPTNIGAKFVGTDITGRKYKEGEATYDHLEPEWVILYKDLDGNVGRLAYNIALERNAAGLNSRNDFWTQGFCRQIPDNINIMALATLQYRIHLDMQKYQRGHPIYDRYRPQLNAFVFFEDAYCSEEFRSKLRFDDVNSDFEQDKGILLWDYFGKGVDMKGIKSILPLFARFPGDTLSNYYKAVGETDPMVEAKYKFNREKGY